MKAFQQALNDLAVDPKLVAYDRLGPATRRRAVKEFQAAAGIGVEGIPGPVTEAAIKLRQDTIRDIERTDGGN